MNANRRRLIWFEITKRKKLKESIEQSEIIKEEKDSTSTPPYKWDEEDSDYYVSQR